MPSGDSRTEQDPDLTARDALRSEADRCVKCGMCLPECPTYRLSSNESESPRGRIALIEGLLNGALDADSRLFSHLDSCLLCRRCERVCPSQVHYGLLMDRMRERLPIRHAGILSRITQQPRLYRLATRVARVVPEALSRPLGTLHRAHRLARALDDTRAAPAPGHYGALTEPKRGHVGLFTGCATAAQQGGALHDALLLLRTAGFAVEIPDSAGCCGALAIHQGARSEAQRLAAQNRAAFDRGLDAVVSIASGCGVQLDAYDPPLTAPHFDICRLLRETAALDTTDLRPLPTRVLLHTPCTVENVYRGSHWAHELLSLIPEIEIQDAGEPGQCCGSAGDYMLRHPETAAHLRQPIIEQARAAGVTILATSNIGCALHIAAGLGQNAGIEVLHPVQLLARQLAQPAD